jgi:uncharacterized protein (DUF924 family)
LSERDAITPADIIAFWREAGPKKWFYKDTAFDETIRERFGALQEAAASGRKDAWAETPDGALALLLLLDQFSRNLHRNSPRMYAQDEKASELAKRAVEAQMDQAVEPQFRRFFGLPFMHSESLENQRRSVLLAHAYGDPETLKYARHHAGIIRRFGRFPHRNAILGRHTTPAEQAFIDGGGFAG